MTPTAAVAMIDPYGPVALRLAEAVHRVAGLPTYAIHRSARRAAETPRRHHLPRSLVAGDALLSDVLAGRGCPDRPRIRAVLPHAEVGMAAAADVAEVLDVDAAPVATWRRFLDKEALLASLARQDPGLRLPITTVVQGVGDLRPHALSPTIVLKPVRGAGSVGVARFARSDVGGIAAHLASRSASRWLVQEWLDGVEFNVNGQVRSDGTVDVLSVFRSVRTTVGTHPAVNLYEVQVSHTDASFAPVRAYTERVVGASALRGSPFHLELIIDADGPCLIDLACRFGGLMIPIHQTWSHGGSPDAFVLAALGYLGLDGGVTLSPDWGGHDGRRVQRVFGRIHRPGRVVRVRGEQAVERRPTFLDWVVPPRRLRLVPATTDLTTVPWVVALELLGDPVADEAERAAVGRLLRLDQDGPLRSPCAAADVGRRVVARTHARALARRYGR